MLNLSLLFFFLRYSCTVQYLASRQARLDSISRLDLDETVPLPDVHDPVAMAEAFNGEVDRIESGDSLPPPRLSAQLCAWPAWSLGYERKAKLLSSSLAGTS